MPRSSDAPIADRQSNGIGAVRGGSPHSSVHLDGEAEEEEEYRLVSSWWGTRGSRSAASPFARVSRHTMYFSALGTRHTQPLRPPPSAHPPPEPWTLEHRAPSTEHPEDADRRDPPPTRREPPEDDDVQFHPCASRSIKHHHHHHHHQAHHSIIIRRSRRRIDMSSSGYRDEDISWAFRSERREAPYTNRPRVRPSAEIVPRKLSRGNPAEIPSSPRSYE